MKSSISTVSSMYCILLMPFNDDELKNYDAAIAKGHGSAVYHRSGGDG